MRARVGIVGGRGHVGQELLGLLLRHPSVEVAFLSSRSAGSAALRGLPSAAPVPRFEELDAAAVAGKGADAVVLALPNGLSAPFVAALDAAQPGAVVLDLSADRRLDDAWVYGLPELFRDRLRGARRIANPGCYATAAVLSLAPVAGWLAGPAHAFGVSGYSGAGTTPSPRNDPEILRDSLIPYQLVGHQHEQEVARHGGPVRLLPHVAPFFRGLSVTVAMTFSRAIDRAELAGWYAEAYADEPFVGLTSEVPSIRAVAGTKRALLGGFEVDAEGTHGVVVAALDNLLKGAASQAVQNLNLALGFPESAGLEAS